MTPADHATSTPTTPTLPTPPTMDLVRDAAAIITDLRMADDIIDGIPESVVAEAEQILNDTLAAHQPVTGSDGTASDDRRCTCGLVHPCSRRQIASRALNGRWRFDEPPIR